MRKYILMVSAAIMLTAVGFAQDGKSITFGLKAGANFGNFGGDNSDFVDILSFSTGVEFEDKMRINYNIGGFVNIPLGTSFAIQPELVYSGEGDQYKGDFDGEDIDLTMKLGYLNIPVMFQYVSSGFYAETGPQIGFLMNAKMKAEGGGEEEEDDAKDGFEDINFSWGLGLGYKLANGIGIGARYNMGLSNIAKDSGEDFKLTTNTIQVGLTYTFGGK